MVAFCYEREAHKFGKYSLDFCLVEASWVGFRTVFRSDGIVDVNPSLENPFLKKRGFS